MAQDRFDLKVNGKYISLDELYDLAKEQIVDELECMNNEDALYLGNEIRDRNSYELLYENTEENLNEMLDGLDPYDILNLGWDDYDEFFTFDGYDWNGTNDVWCDLDTDEIADDILEGSYRSYLTSDIKDILDDYEEAKEYLENLNEYRAMAEETLARYLNCEADVTDLLQLIDKLVRTDEVWAEE